MAIPPPSQVLFYLPICLGTSCGATVGAPGLSGLGADVGLMLGMGYPPRVGTVLEPTKVPVEPAEQLTTGQHWPVTLTMLQPRGRLV